MIDNSYDQNQLAWIHAPGNLLLLADSKFSDDGTRRPPWESAISRLIAGVNVTFGEEKYRYLRNRIYTTTSENLWDQQLVKLCAKRVTWSCQKLDPLTEAAKILHIGMTMKASPASCKLAEINATKATHQSVIEILRNLINTELEKWHGQRRHNAPRPVAAIAVGDDDEILAANVNTNVELLGIDTPPARLQFMHAEVNMVLSLAARGKKHLPKGVRIYTSLKPCRMCAALLMEFAPPLASRDDEGPAPKPAMQIFSLADDPGPHGQHHILDGFFEIS